jgi:diaminopimelate epimerase
MRIEFEKWHGCKNDFIVTNIDNRQTDLVIPSLRRAAIDLCSRLGGGIGADGILVLHHDHREVGASPNIRLTIINSDGSLAGNCGNGIRCVAASTYRKLMNDQHKIATEDLLLHVQVQEGASATCHILPGSKPEKAFVALDFGAPVIASNSTDDIAKTQKILALAKSSGISFPPDSVALVNLGNDHAIIFLNERPDKEAFGKFSASLQKQPEWNGINVHAVFDADVESADKQTTKKLFDRITPSRLDMIPWERGVGFTQACGSGAVASVAAACAKGLVEFDQWITVGVPGGTLFVKVDESDGQTTLAGPAEHTFDGILNL